ncbi:sensory transduction histidine kinase [Methanosarcina sp. Kolksee]|uniref:PAS domain S-box protein n=1 Tax=Methanosarcina sp. Kolksee TaxID=1434099 RepID=UPI0006161174|nr:PAS domain S-box protein [Methanosarcina sp. Kolksee]AKB48327.1 sensory transduction histidine kinase [Methanosarcina sp. Kolksee]
MRETLRNSGIDIIGDVPWGTHFCQFYQTKKELMDIVVPYFKAGLEDNEFCLWVTSQPLEVEEAKEALRRAVPDIDIYLEKKQIEIIPYNSWYLRGESFDFERVLNGWDEKLGEALASGYGGLRVAGNASWLKKGYWDDFGDYEKKLDINIGERQIISLCSYLLSMCSAADTIDLAFNHQFSLIKRKGKWERIENPGQKNKTDCKQTEKALIQSEKALIQSDQYIKQKLEDIPSPSREVGKLEINDIIDAQSIQFMMDCFYKIAHIPMSLDDLKGNVLVGVGWQEICTQFHRVHPEACKNCVESDTKLSVGVSPGEFKLYKCKNNMWDIATPIIVGGQHLANIFSGQFFFEDEPLDYELFRSQARKYGFNEEEYIAALEKVPRLSREAVNTGMAFFITFANVISQLGYSNLKLAQSLAERETLLGALQESEERFRSVLENSLDVAYRRNLQTDRYDYMSPVVEKITGFSAKEMSAVNASEILDRIHPDDRPRVLLKRDQAYDTGSGTLEYRFKHKDGKYRWFLDHYTVTKDRNGKMLFIGGIVHDITKRKKAEEALKKAHENLEEKVKERTIELEKAYNSLKESEKGLAEAQKMAHIGNWEWDIETDKAYWSDEMYRIFGRDPQELAPSYNEYLSYIHPDDLDYYRNALKKATKEDLFVIDYRIVLANGEERIVHLKSEFVSNGENTPTKIKGIVQDITESKKAEEKIQKLLNAMESSDDAIITESLECVITSWNKGAEQIYGYSSEEILGKNVSILEPDDLKGEIRQLIEKIKQKEKIRHYKTLRQKKDGTLINVSITLSPVFDASGKLVAISSIVRDVTERIKAEEALRESETRLRRFYESDMIGVCFYNLKGSITEANDKFLEIVGYTREDLLTGQIKWDKMTPPEYSQLDEHAMAELKSKGASTPYEKEYIRKDGSHVPVIIGVATFNKVLYEGLAFVLDITEKKKAEEALSNLETARKKEIHHRIKNNLQVISSLLDLQAEKFDNPKVIEAFRESQNRVISMALIHEELYKGEGADTLNFSEYLKKLAENLFQTYRLYSKNLNLFTDLEENAFFNMDTAVPLGIIVNELVSNSLKHAFTEDQEGEVRIKLCREGTNDEISKSLFSLTVSDNGIGIPENLELESLESLGLQLVDILVDQLDGKIELKRKQGVEFKITFSVVENPKSMN